MQVYREGREAVMVLDDGTYSARLFDTEEEADECCQRLVMEMFQFIADGTEMRSENELH